MLIFYRSKSNGFMTALLLVYGLLFLWQTAYAAITVTSGGNQQAFAGAESADIVFTVADEFGHPTTVGTSVNFNLLNPSGSIDTAGLSNFSDKTDEKGEVSTRLNNTETLGQYIVIATLVADATQTVSTPIRVLKDASVFAVTAGENQEVFTGSESADIVITLIDQYGKPKVAASMEFSLIDSSGKAMSVGLTQFAAKTDDNGQVSTRLKATEVVGQYTITATLATDSAQSVSTTITVLEDARAIKVISGADQQVPAGSESAEIVFTVLDKYGKPDVGTQVNFSLLDSAGNSLIAGLSRFSGQTNDKGQVSTLLRSMKVLGNYTITATLATDSALSTTVQVAVVLDVLTNVAIALISGGHQMVPAGSDSGAIVFQVTNKGGNPSTDVSVDFSLVDPLGESISQNGLTVGTAETDQNGRVSTRLKGRGLVGHYTLTATVATDTALFTGTSLVVVAGIAAQLKVIEGADQTISAGHSSARIRFKLLDAFNNGIGGQVVNFEAKTPAGAMSSGSLSATLATSDINGEVTTRLETTDIEGIYTVTAKLANNEAVAASTTVLVTEAVPDLPSLGFGAIFNSEDAVDTEAIFQGGISVNMGTFSQEVLLRASDSVLIKGVIKVDSEHIGSAADILVVVGYQPVNGVESFFMLDNQDAVPLWDGNPEHLVAFKNIERLPMIRVVNIYSGQLPAGKLRIYFGYRLEDGTIVFNANQAIHAVITR